MRYQDYDNVLHDISDAIIHDVYEGFREDYLVIHSLIRRHRPNSLFEVGTNEGGGLNVLCNAIYKYEPEAKVYSLDLPYETMRLNSKQYPIGANGEDRVGSAAKFPYTQLRGDSLTFDYNSVYPIEAWFIDGEHDREHVFHETYKAKTMNSTKLIMWHDANIPEVWSGIVEWFAAPLVHEWKLVRVNNTRVAYAIRDSNQ